MIIALSKDRQKLREALRDLLVFFDLATENEPGIWLDSALARIREIRQLVIRFKP
jgi:hypothetical protein